MPIPVNRGSNKPAQRKGSQVTRRVARKWIGLADAGEWGRAWLPAQAPGLQAPTISARDLGSHESRDRGLLALEVKKPPTAVVSYVSVRSRSRRYPQSRELSSSSRGGPSGAKARAHLLCGAKWGNLRARAKFPRPSQSVLTLGKSKGGTMSAFKRLEPF